MSNISVSTKEREDGIFEVSYHLHDAHPLANGIVEVELSQHEKLDRPIIAELAALQHLLCEAKVCGAGRTGHGLNIDVSFGAIKRAVLHGAIKSTDSGKTDKTHIVRYAHFLATIFFEASKEVVNNPAWAKGCMIAKYARHRIRVEAPKEASLATNIGAAVISRHALSRFVERFIARDLLGRSFDDGATIVGVEDLDPKYWTRAWKSLERLLNSPDTVLAPIASSKFSERMVHKYGKQAKFLHHADSQAIFILVPSGKQLVLATVVRDFEESKLIQKPPKYVGGRLVKA